MVDDAAGLTTFRDIQRIETNCRFINTEYQETSLTTFRDIQRIETKFRSDPVRLQELPV